MLYGASAALFCCTLWFCAGYGSARCIQKTDAKTPTATTPGGVGEEDTPMARGSRHESPRLRSAPESPAEERSPADVRGNSLGCWPASDKGVIVSRGVLMGGYVCIFAKPGLGCIEVDFEENRSRILQYQGFRVFVHYFSSSVSLEFYIFWHSSKLNNLKIAKRKYHHNFGITSC